MAKKLIPNRDGSDPLEIRLSHLESHVRHLEDLVEIYQIMAMYGPAVDSNSQIAAANLFSEEGKYDLWSGGEWSEAPLPGHSGGKFAGRRGSVGMLSGQRHQDRLADGCAHQVNLPHVVIRGDWAAATCYQSLIMRRDDSWVIDRQTANRWEFARGAGGWEVTLRTNRALDGSEDAQELLRRGVDESRQLGSSD